MVKKVFFDITNRCNGDCIHCFVDAVNNDSVANNELSDDEIENMIVTFSQNGVSGISLGGGEPFLRDIPEICNFANGKIDVSVTSNGTILNENIVNCLRHTNVRLTISLDAIDNNISQKVRKGIDVNLVIANIEKMLKYDEIRKKLSIRTTISKHNLDRVIDIINFCNDRSIPTLKVNSINLFGRAKKCKEIVPDFDVFINTLNYLKIFCSENNLNTRVELPVQKYLVGAEHSCSLGKNSLYINSYGDIFPCAFSEGNMKLGNIKDVDMSEIFEKCNQFDYRNNTCNLCPIHRYKNCL